jgi:hypothetical protein
MKRVLSVALASAIALSAPVAMANGGGVVIAPPAEPAPAPAAPPPAVVEAAVQQQPWWLYVLGVAVIVGIVIAVSNDD